MPPTLGRSHCEFDEHSIWILHTEIDPGRFALPRKVGMKLALDAASSGTGTKVCVERWVDQHLPLGTSVVVTNHAGEWLVEYIRGLAFERQHTRLLEEGAVLATRGVRSMYWGLRQKAAKNLRRFWR
jgi:hypothetical protein